MDDPGPKEKSGAEHRVPLSYRAVQNPAVMCALDDARSADYVFHGHQRPQAHSRLRPEWSAGS